MPLTIAQIAEKALTAAGRAIPDAIQPCALIKATQGAYSTTAGQYALSEVELTGRAVLETMTPARMAAFPALVAGPTDQMWFLEGLTDVQENDHLWFGQIGRDGKPLTRIIKATPQPIGGSRTTWRVIAA